MIGNKILDIRTLAPGAYVLHAVDVEGNMPRERFVKE